MVEHVKVPFSGGIDSFFAITQELEQGNHVYPFYVRMVNNKNKTACEEQVARFLIDQLNRHYQTTMKLHIGGDIDSSHLTNYCMMQMTTWIYMVQGVKLTASIDRLAIPFVADDEQSIPWIPYLIDLNYALEAFEQTENGIAPLSFTILDWSKEEIREWVRHSGIFDLDCDPEHFFWTCERPTFFGMVDTDDYLPIDSRYLYYLHDMQALMVKTPTLKCYIECGRCHKCQAKHRRVNQLSHEDISHVR